MENQNLVLDPDALAKCPDIVFDRMYTCQICGLGHDMTFTRVQMFGGIRDIGYMTCPDQQEKIIVCIDGKNCMGEDIVKEGRK